MNQKVVALHGGYITENFGDELLMVIHSNWIREVGYEIAMPYCSQEYRAQINPVKETGLNALKISDLLIYGGGGYLGEPNYDYLRWGMSFFKRKHFVPAEYFHLKKKPYAIIGVGAGPITNLLTRAEIVRMCNNATFVVTRDVESRNYLYNYGVKPEKISVTADNVLSLEKKDIPINALLEVEKLYNITSRKLKFGIHIGVTRKHIKQGKAVGYVLDACVDFFNKNPEILPVLIADKRNSREQEEIIKELSERLKGNFMVFRHSDIWLTCALLSVLDGVLTTKLHVGITAFALETRAMSLAAHQKTVRFYKQINQEHNCLPLEVIRDKSQVLNKLYSFTDSLGISSEMENKIRVEIRKTALKNKELTQKFILEHVNS